MSLAAPAAAGSGPFERYYVLRISDYETVTGCSVNGHNYWRPLKSALQFLVFAEANDTAVKNGMQYARRHTLPLFRSLYRDYATTGGIVAERCMATSLRQIGYALKLLDAKGHYRGAPFAKMDFVYDPALLEEGQIDPRAFPVMSRAKYIATTGCKISAESYLRYRTGFDWIVFRSYYEERSRTAMIDFLEDLFAGQPAADGFVDQRCMIPAISRIAAEFGLLDDTGRYRSQR